MIPSFHQNSFLMQFDRIIKRRLTASFIFKCLKIKKKNLNENRKMVSIQIKVKRNHNYIYYLLKLIRINKSINFCSVIYLHLLTYSLLLLNVCLKKVQVVVFLEQTVSSELKVPLCKEFCIQHLLYHLSRFTKIISHFY